MTGSAPAGPAGAASRTVVIRNRRGLHARAAAKFVKTAERFDAEIMVARQGGDGAAPVESVSGRSIMGLMMLAAALGASLTLNATGREAAAALDALEQLVAERFQED